MNFLAHVYLAGGSDELLIGSVLGDCVKGSDLTKFSEAVGAGIRLHRRIDAFSDTHPVVGASKRRIGEANRRYAGPLVDLFYDHFLAASWHRYADGSLEEF